MKERGQKEIDKNILSSETKKKETEENDAIKNDYKIKVYI